MNAKQIKAKQIKIAEELSQQIIEANHVEALQIEANNKQAMLSHKEICAQRRASAYETTSIFTKSINSNSSCYQLECLLNDFHSENQLVRMMNTSEMLQKCNTAQVTRSRIRSHLSHLKRKFAQTVRYIEKVEQNVVVFKFELK